MLPHEFEDLRLSRHLIVWRVHGQVLSPVALLPPRSLLRFWRSCGLRDCAVHQRERCGRLTAHPPTQVF
jgi:hypothetical protein